MNDVPCGRCKETLHDFGGLLFSPPDHTAKVVKLHLCKSCYYDVLVFICDTETPTMETT